MDDDVAWQPSSPSINFKAGMVTKSAFNFLVKMTPQKVKKITFSGVISLKNIGADSTEFYVVTTDK